MTEVTITSTDTDISELDEGLQRLREDVTVEHHTPRPLEEDNGDNSGGGGGEGLRERRPRTQNEN